jgi:hypothetical protein
MNNDINNTDENNFRILIQNYCNLNLKEIEENTFDKNFIRKMNNFSFYINSFFFLYKYIF